MTRINRSRRIIFTAIGLAILAGAAFVVADKDRNTSVSAQSFPALRPDNLSGFAVAEPGRTFDFPADHGPHHDYQTEWWYFTGNLTAESGDQFGYQLTFFRRALVPPSEFDARENPWATNEVYLAHFTITDVNDRQFYHLERLARGGDTGLAGARSEPFEVWLENWQVVATSNSNYELKAAQNGMAINLSLIDAKGPILQGDGGYSPKSPDSNDASYYYSLTRLESTGTITTPSGTYEVAGFSWMDHEFSTSALAEGQVGWDWFGLQLDNGYEIMAFQLRSENGPLEETYTFVLVNPDGEVATSEAFTLEVQDTWNSPHTGAPYPAGWIMTVPSLDLTLRINPLLADQELNVSFTYWEGAVELDGELGTEQVGGRGYVELTGYAESMAGQF